MKSVIYLFILSIMFISCNDKEQNKVQNNCESDTVLVIQSALNNNILDSVISNSYHDSTLKMIKTKSLNSLCSLTFRGKDIVFLDSNDATMEIDPGDFIKGYDQEKEIKYVKGTRIPTFKLVCSLKYMDKNKAALSLILRNQGLIIDFKLVRINESWNVIETNWGKI